MWWLVVTVSVPSDFSDLMMLGVCCEFLCPLQSLCHALSYGVNHNTTARDDFSHLHPLPADRPGCPVPPVVEGWHSGDSLYHPIQWVEIKDWATWELIQGFGYSGSSLPSCPSLSLNNLLYREDFPGLHTG